MKQTPRVAALTIYYNRENFVDSSLNSLINQSFQGLKIVALDDGSTDSTFERLRRFESENVEVRTHPNMGFTRTLVQALENIDADFVAIHGSGDISYFNRIERQVEALLNDPEAAFSATDSRTLDAVTGRQLSGKSFNSSRLEFDDILRAPPFTHGTVMLRMEKYRAVGGYDPFFKFSSDWDLWGRILRDSHCAHVPEVLYDQFAQEDGATFNAAKSVEQIKYNLFIQKKLAMTAEEASSYMRDVSSCSLDEILADDKPQIFRAAFKRAVKLTLMRRTAAAADILRLSGAENHLSVSERLILRSAGIVAQLPAGPRIGTMLARLFS